MKQLNKLQVLRKVAEHYNLGNRSIDEKRKCVYLNNEGRTCAFGMFCKDPAHVNTIRNFSDNTPSALFLMTNYSNILQEEVEHITDGGFWDDVQKLHDFINNWVEEGLSMVGRNYYNKLIFSYMVKPKKICRFDVVYI